MMVKDYCGTVTSLREYCISLTFQKAGSYHLRAGFSDCASSELGSGKANCNTRISCSQQDLKSSIRLSPMPLSTVSGESRRGSLLSKSLEALKVCQVAESRISSPVMVEPMTVYTALYPLHMGSEHLGTPYAPSTIA